MLATQWPSVLTETIACDVTLRQLQREPGSKGAKAFDLSRRHSLPPDVVTLFRASTTGELVPYRIDLGTTLTEEEQHAISPWRDAAYDGPGSPLVLGKGGRVEALKTWALNRAKARGVTIATKPGRNSLPSSFKALNEKYQEHLSELRPNPTAPTAAPASGKRKQPKDTAVARAPAPELALRIHCDVNDAQSLPGANIQSDSTDDSVLGGELVLDGFEGEGWAAIARRRALPRQA